MKYKSFRNVVFVYKVINLGSIIYWNLILMIIYIYELRCFLNKLLYFCIGVIVYEFSILICVRWYL